jgi:hypothetical protein
VKTRDRLLPSNLGHRHDVVGTVERGTALQRLGNRFSEREKVGLLTGLGGSGRDTAAGFCPTTSFEPENGFSLDRALLYAIVRQESYFNPKAVSVSNARGLMQLLPSTARDMDRSHNYRRTPAPLFEPGLNMRLGQDYVQWLMAEFHSDGDLGRVFAAYNGGPGWLSRWLATQPSDLDPLLILEMMPRAESRDYAERALSHLTLCRKRYGQPTPEMDRLAAGGPALYTPLDGRVAQR